MKYDVTFWAKDRQSDITVTVESENLIHSIEKARSMIDNGVELDLKNVKEKSFQKKLEALDYSKCVEHVETVLGYDIRDTLGKFRKENKGNYQDIEYRDWWHYLIKMKDIHNGCLVTIGSELLGAEPWQDEITQCFIDEFGDNQTYWVEW